jgi:tetratricopeptide (TPR) repeat protein
MNSGRIQWILAGVLLCAPAALAHRNHAFGSVFDNVSPAGAFELAKKEFTLVLVYVTRPGGKASDCFETPSWEDWRKIDLLIREVVLVKVDPSWGLKEMAPYRIEEPPVILLLDAEGEELERWPGDISLDRLVSGLAAKLNDKAAVARARRAVDRGGGKNPYQRERLAQTLLRHGSFAEALEEFMWCVGVGLEENMRFAAARREFVFKDLVALIKQYPPAEQALREQQEAMTERLLVRPDDINLAGNLVELNARLQEDERTLALFDALPEGSRTRRILFDRVLNLLVKKKRYGEVIAAPNPNRAFRYSKDLAVRDANRAFKKEVNLARMRRAPKDEPPEAYLERGTRAFAIRRGAALVEALAALGRTEEAKELMERVVRFDDSPHTLSLLKNHVRRAGHEELADQIGKEAAESGEP